MSSAGSYLVVSARAYQKISRWNKLFQRKDGSKRRFRKGWDQFVFAEIQQQNNSCNVVDICRKMIEEHVQGKYAIVYDIVVDEQQERLFFVLHQNQMIEYVAYTLITS